MFPVPYKQTVIGIAWALIRPFLMMVVFTVIFGRLASCRPMVALPCADGLRRHGYRGVFFERLERCVQRSASNEHLVNLPRLIAPTAAATSALSQRVRNRGPALTG
jgi:lipopolysaccharide transport system permease protein